MLSRVPRVVKANRWNDYGNALRGFGIGSAVMSASYHLARAGDRQGFEHMLRDGRQIPDCVLDDAYLASRRDLTPQVIETSRRDSTPQVIETSRCNSTPQVVEARRHPSFCRFTRIAGIALLQVSIVVAIAAIAFGTQAAFRVLAASGVNGIAEFSGSRDVATRDESPTSDKSSAVGRLGTLLLCRDGCADFALHPLPFDALRSTSLCATRRRSPSGVVLWFSGLQASPCRSSHHMARYVRHPPPWLCTRLCLAPIPTGRELRG